MSLERGSISELLKIIEADVYFRRHVQIRSDAKRIHFVVRTCLVGCDSWSSLISELPLMITNHAELQAPLAAERDRVCHRVVEIQRLSRMNLSSLLPRVNLI